MINAADKIIYGKIITMDEEKVVQAVAISLEDFNSASLLGLYVDGVNLLETN